VNTSDARHPALLVIADDLSGAADCAVAGTRAGLHSAVCFGGQPGGRVPTLLHPVDVLAVDVDSRRASAVSAAVRHAAAWRAYASADTRLYKKLDSTLRGNVGDEIASLVPLAGMAIVAPALPAQGRVTRAGRQYLHGQPVEASETWRNEGIAGRADLCDMLSRAGQRVASITLADIRAGRDALAARLAACQRERFDAVVCDAETDADLRDIAVASATMARVFWAGSAGLAPAVIAAMGMSGVVRAIPDAIPAQVAGRRPVLAVVGSMSSVSHEQAARLKAAAGAALYAVEAGVDTARLTDVANAVANALRDGRDVLVTMSQSTRNQADGPALCQGLATALAVALPQAGALIATGGETARALLATIDVDALRIVDEVEPGLPLLMANPKHLAGAAMPVVTKAGAFGAPDALVAAWRRLTTTLPSAMTSQGNPAMNNRPVIGITMGDAAGVGPEIIMKALTHRHVYDACCPLVIGDAQRLRDAGRRAGVALEVRAVAGPAQALFQPGVVDCIDLGLIPADLPYGKLSPIAGDAAYQYIARTVALASAGELDAICTAPLNKEALHAGGHIFPGHTEMLAHLTGVDEVSMMLVAPKLRVIHVTTHIGLLDAIRRIEPGLVQRTIERAHATLERAGIANPRIGVCGINPHAGENGLFGYGEEEEKIMPAIAVVQARGWRVEGPLPADTLFFRAGRGDFDVVVAMYHDQGHGPVKVMGLEAGVNVTVGLPVIRTSVDHGTAFDIAGTGIADERSMLEAFRQACELATRRNAGAGTSATGQEAPAQIA